MTGQQRPPPVSVQCGSGSVCVCLLREVRLFIFCLKSQTIRNPDFRSTAEGWNDQPKKRDARFFWNKVHSGLFGLWHTFSLHSVSLRSPALSFHTFSTVFSVTQSNKHHFLTISVSVSRVFHLYKIMQSLCLSHSLSFFLSLSFPHYLSLSFLSLSLPLVWSCSSQKTQQAGRCRIELNWTDFLQV